MSVELSKNLKKEDCLHVYVHIVNASLEEENMLLPDKSFHMMHENVHVLLSTY